LSRLLRKSTLEEFLNSHMTQKSPDPSSKYPSVTLEYPVTGRTLSSPCHRRSPKRIVPPQLPEFRKQLEQDRGDARNSIIRHTQQPSEGPSAKQESQGNPAPVPTTLHKAANKKPKEYRCHLQDQILDCQCQRAGVGCPVIPRGVIVIEDRLDAMTTSWN